MGSGRGGAREAWTEEEDEAVRRAYPVGGVAACMEATGRSQSAVYSRIKRLGLVEPGRRGRGRVWSTREDREAVSMLARVCRDTGRTPISVVHHLEYLVRKAQRQGGGLHEP